MIKCTLIIDSARPLNAVGTLLCRRAIFHFGKATPMDSVAGAATVMISDHASYITGSTFVVDGGLLRNYRRGNDAREN